MKNAKAKKKKGSVLTGFVVALFMICFTAVIVVNFMHQMEIYTALQQQEGHIAEEMEKERKKSVELLARQQYYNSDAYIEKAAREQLGYVKPDEILFINNAE